MNRVESKILQHEGQSYLEVTSTDDTGATVYTHAAWVDNDPRLHEVLLAHHWSLNQRTGHLTTHSLSGVFLDALEAQGDVPAIVPLPRCLAAAVAGGKKIKRVFAEPTDYRYEALTIEWDRGATPTALSIPPVAEPERTLMVGTTPLAVGSTAAQRRAIADARRAEADARREIAEQRAARQHFERLEAQRKREEIRNVRIGGKAMRDACIAEAKLQCDAAAARGEAWAIQSLRRIAGHAPRKSDIVHQSPAWYLRLCNGLPKLLTMEEAQNEHPQRLQRSQAAFEEFCHTLNAQLSRAAMRAAWLKAYPAHDWVEWEDSKENYVLRDPMPREVAQQPLLPAPPKQLLLPAPGADLRTQFNLLWDDTHFPEVMDAESEKAWDAKLLAASEDRFAKEDVLIARHQAVKEYHFKIFEADPDATYARINAQFNPPEAGPTAAERVLIAKFMETGK